jgi:hypothetical protein
VSKWCDTISVLLGLRSLYGDSRGADPTDRGAVIKGPGRGVTSSSRLGLYIAFVMLL